MKRLRTMEDGTVKEQTMKRCKRLRGFGTVKRCGRMKDGTVKNER
jgi:hypothetical protein